MSKFGRDVPNRRLISARDGTAASDARVANNFAVGRDRVTKAVAVASKPLPPSSTAMRWPQQR
jgi:hypothetical protein